MRSVALKAYFFTLTDIASAPQSARCAPAVLRLGLVG